MPAIPLPLGYSRLDPFPLDETFVFSSFASLTSYALTNPTAYAGQVCAVTATNKTYIINGNKTIQEVGSNLDSLTVNNSISARGILFGTAPDSSLSITSTRAVQNSAITAALQLLSPAPTYNQPSVSLSNFSSSQVELGTTINQTLNLSWSPGDAGALQNWILNKNSTRVLSGTSNLPNTFGVNEIATLATVTYQLSGSHATGLIKNNILGFPDERGRILAGSRTDSKNYTGYYRYFYGSVASVPTDLRTLPSSKLGTDNSIPSFTASENNIVIVIPFTKLLQSVITQNLEDITGSFAQTTVSVNDASGTPQQYRRYVATSSIPLNLGFQSITLSDAPLNAPTYNVTPNSGSVNEGSSVTFNITTTNVDNGTVLYWTLAGVTGTINSSDFTSGISGSVTINSSAGSVIVVTNSDTFTEGAESFKFQLRTSSTSGPIVSESSNVTINDTSISPPTSFLFSLSGLGEQEDALRQINITNPIAATDKIYYNNYDGATSTFTSMNVFINGSARMQVNYTVDRVGTEFGYSINPNASTPQATGLFASGNVFLVLPI